MCVFFPLVLLLGAVVWILPIPNPFSIAWNVLLLVGIVVVVRRMRQAPSAVPGLGAEDLRGAACPSSSRQQKNHRCRYIVDICRSLIACLRVRGCCLPHHVRDAHHAVDERNLCRFNSPLLCFVILFLAVLPTREAPSCRGPSLRQEYATPPLVAKTPLAARVVDDALFVSVRLPLPSDDACALLGGRGVPRLRYSAQRAALSASGWGIFRLKYRLAAGCHLG